MTEATNLAGQTFGRLTVISRAPSSNAGHARWHCRCECGNETTPHASALRKGLTVSCGCFHTEWNAGNHKAVVSYCTAHQRVSRQRGVAKSHPCVDCAGPARDWSYDGLDPDELFEVIGNSRLAYSLDINRYVPRCRDCHSAHDALARREVMNHG